MPVSKPDSVDPLVGQSEQTEKALRELDAIDREVDRDRIRKLISAGNALADMLRYTPGIDPMRSLVLDEWKEAKRVA